MLKCFCLRPCPGVGYRIMHGDSEVTSSLLAPERHVSHRLVLPAGEPAAEIISLWWLLCTWYDLGVALRYEFKFIVDGTWTTSDDMEQTKCTNRRAQPVILEIESQEQRRHGERDGSGHPVAVRWVSS